MKKKTLVFIIIHTNLYAMVGIMVFGQKARIMFESKV